MNLYEMIQRLGHEDRRIYILKIDCEGCEWTIYHDWLIDSPTQYVAIGIITDSNSQGTGRYTTNIDGNTFRTDQYRWWTTSILQFHATTTLCTFQ